jgi:hypothetical protein
MLARDEDLAVAEAGQETFESTAKDVELPAEDQRGVGDPGAGVQAELDASGSAVYYCIVKPIH